MPTKLSFGFGALDTLPSEAAQLNARRALIVTDKVMVRTGAVGKVTSRLGQLPFVVFDAIEPEPGIESADLVAKAVRERDYDLVVGVGGGSVMDMAKLAAGFATNGGPAKDFVGNNLFHNRPIRSIMVPTTAGTGAEITITSMVTVEGHKRWINSPSLLPTVAIVDPELTMTMPKSVTASTGIDALCHNTEAYLSSLASPVTDAAALEGVRLIVANLERAHDDGSDRRAREAMSLGALLGGIALQARMVYGHSVGYTVATRFNLAHGVSCGIPLPYVIANYWVACAPKMKRLAEAFGVPSSGDDPKEFAMAAAERARSIAQHLGIPTSLKELGVKKVDLPTLARECMEMYPRPNSPLVFDESSMSHFYDSMWEGRLSA